MRFNLSLIQSFTDADNMVARPVVVTHFQRGGKNLFYINASHVSGRNNSTSRTVKAAVSQLNPGFIVVEADTGSKRKREGLVAFAHQQKAAHFNRSGDMAYAVYLADTKGIPFAGGEPSYKDIFEGMQKEGHSAKDVMCFYLLNVIPYWRRHGILDETNFGEQAWRHIQRFWQQAGLLRGKQPKFSEFKDWYAKHNTTGKGFLQIEDTDLAPIHSSTSNYFQKLHHAIDPIRERHIDTVIDEALAIHDNVLVVYGDAHLVKSRPVFEDAFGPGTPLKLG